MSKALTEPKPSGGLAFPVSDGNQTDPGMSLRDWFAGQCVNAASNMTLNYMPVSNPKFQENVARHAYALADAMIAHGDQS